VSVIDTPVVLPKLAFLAAWDMVDLGEPHPIVGTNHHYVTSGGYTRDLHARTMTLLADHGLARGDRLNPLWKNSLLVIAEAGREFYGWSHHTGGNSRGALLVASLDGQAVRVAADDHVVTLDPVPDKWLASRLLDALPDVPAADIKPVTVAEEFYNDPNAAPASPLAEPVDTADVDHINLTMAAPRDAVHQLYTAARDAAGQRHRSSPITAIDLTSLGRILTYRTAGAHIVLQPGSPRDIVATLNDTHDALRAAD
jgi:hypothetical protein